MGTWSLRVRIRLGVGAILLISQAPALEFHKGFATICIFCVNPKPEEPKRLSPESRPMILPQRLRARYSKL